MKDAFAKAGEWAPVHALIGTIAGMVYAFVNLSDHPKGSTVFTAIALSVGIAATLTGVRMLYSWWRK